MPVDKGITLTLNPSQEWSPVQIAGRMQQPANDEARTALPQTVYAWIRRNPRREHWESFLRRRGKRPGRRREATGRADSARIAGRPKVIEQLLRLLDFEGDIAAAERGGGVAWVCRYRSRLSAADVLGWRKTSKP